MNPPSKPTVCILDQTALSVCLMEIVAAQLPISSPERDAPCNTRDPKKPGIVTVELRINGVEVPDPIKRLAAALREVMELLLREQDRDTRHACAEAVLKLQNSASDSAIHLAQRAHQACMNAHSI